MSDWRERAEAERRRQEVMRQTQASGSAQEARERLPVVKASLAKLVADLQPVELLTGFNRDIWEGKGKIDVQESARDDAKVAYHTTFLSAHVYHQRTRTEPVKERKFGIYYTNWSRSSMGEVYESGQDRHIGLHDEIVGWEEVPYQEGERQQIELTLSSGFPSNYFIKYRDTDVEKIKQKIAEELGFNHEGLQPYQFKSGAPFVDGYNGNIITLDADGSYDPVHFRQFLERCILHSALIRT